MCPPTHNPNAAVVDADRALRGIDCRKWPGPYAHPKLHILPLPSETRVLGCTYHCSNVAGHFSRPYASLVCSVQSNQTQLGLPILSSWEKLRVPPWDPAPSSLDWGISTFLLRQQPATPGLCKFNLVEKTTTHLWQGNGFWPDTGKRYVFLSF